MKRIFLLLCLTAVAARGAPSLSMTSAPSNVNSGQSYYIEAQCWDSWGGVTVTIYKNGAYFASNYGSSPVYAGGSTSDTGPTTITYRIEAVNDFYETDTIYHYVTVAAPANDPPTIQWVNAPSSVPAGQNFTVQAKGMDGDGNLTNVSVWRDGSPFAFNGGGNGYENTSDGNWHSQGTAGSINFHAQAKDSNDATSSYIYHTVYITKLNQTITFNQPATQTYGTNLNLSASASSGLGVSFSVLSGPAYLSGNTLVFTGAGSVGVRASQGGNGTYNAATNVDRTITVNKANQTISFSQPSAQTYGGQLALGATASSGLGVTYSVIAGSGSISFGTITFTAAGSVTVRASQAGNANYNAASNVDRTITVNKAGQTITFSQPSAQTHGGQLNLSASASSGLSVSYSVVSGPANLSGSTLTFTGAGSVVVRASQGGNANYNVASNVDRTITVNKANQTITFDQPSAQTYGTPLNLSATSDSGLGVSYSVVSGPASLSGASLTFTGAGSVVVRASQGGNANYNAAANVDRTIAVNKATPSGTFANRSLGTQTPTTYTVQAGDLNAVFNGPVGAAAPTGTVTYTLVGPDTAVISGTELGVDSHTIRASYPGDSNYESTYKDAVWNVVTDLDEDGMPGYIEDLLGTDPDADDHEDDTTNQNELNIHHPIQ